MIANLPVNVPVRTQNPRDYTVQIRRVSDNLIVGTGIVVSSRQIVTCAHVVVAAGVNPRKDKPIPSPWEQFLKTIFNPNPDINSDKVVIYFPQARGGEKNEFHATVAACFPDHDDDVVLLQLVGGSAPIGPEQIAQVGTAEESHWHKFRAYGYRRLDAYEAGWAQGEIHDVVEPRVDRTVHLEPVEINSNQINRGMSGAGVLDIERNLVVGIVSETWIPPVNKIEDIGSVVKDLGTSWAVNTRVLTIPPFDLKLRDDPLPLKPAPSPSYNAAEAKAAIAPIEKLFWNSTPTLLEEWTGRDELLQKINDDWNNSNIHVVSLIGFGGEGKSSLARKWVDNLLNDSSLPQPEGVFWWGFYENRNVDEFFESLLNWLTGGKKDPNSIPSSSAKAAFIAGMLATTNRYLFVLDGLEVLQHQKDDQYGLFQNSDLRDFITLGLTQLVQSD